MSNELAPPESELAELFEAERDFPWPPAESKARVWDAVQGSIVIPPSGGGGGGDGGAGPAAGGAAGGAAAGTGTKIALAGLVTLAVGAGIGFVAHDAIVEPPPPERIEVPVEVRVEVPVEVPVEVLVAVPATAQLDAGMAVVAARQEPGARPRSDLAAERAVIDAARTAIARGNTTSALAAINRHALEYPRGRLVEEREGLRVIALVRAGRRPEAQNRADRFRQRYPNSVLLPAIDSALR